MTLYTRHQLLLLVLLVVAAGAGLAIDHWRRAHPDLVERVETIDRRAPVVPVRVERRRSAPAPPTAPLDVNRASEAELARLPGVGTALATRIVAARPFDEVDDLRRVRGLRGSALERLRPFVTIER